MNTLINQLIATSTRKIDSNGNSVHTVKTQLILDAGYSLEQLRKAVKTNKHRITKAGTLIKIQTVRLGYDLINLLADAKNMRDEVVAQVAIINGKLSIHFTAGPLQGEDCNNWIPLKRTPSADHLVFAEVEEIMLKAKVAHNCTSISHIRGEEGKYADYRIVFNIYDEKLAAA